MAVAIHSRPNQTPVPIAAARPQPKRRDSGKENLVQFKPTATLTGLTNIRPRRERPCDACRRRKSRCVIHEGAVLCVLCEFHKQDCTFVQDPQPRKRKVPVPAAGDQTEPGSKKRSVDAPAPPQHQQKPQQKFARGPSSQTSTPKPASQFENLVLGETLGLQSDKHGRHLGLTSPFEPMLIGLSTFDSRNESILSLGTLRRVNNNETFIMYADNAAQDFGDDADALAAIDRVVTPHGPALLDLYFKIVHSSFPIIQKNVFLERYRNGDRQYSPSLLAGMYILAINWWSFDQDLSKHDRPDVKELDAIASRSLAAAMDRPKLSTVQAGLLLLQRPEANSWSLTTQLVAIGQELGLHLDCSNWSIPLWERGLRKRIAWALYMQDKWSSLIHGRPSHIFSANWAVKPLSDEDGGIDPQVNPNMDTESEEDKLELERGQILFKEMIHLTAIMAEVMDTFYTQVAIQEFSSAGINSTQLILERAKPVQIKLRDWFAKLPQSVKMENVERLKLAPTGFLHLAYFATEITLHRRIIQSLSQDNSNPYLFYICRSAAKTRLISAMDFVNRLRPEHLQAFWYFPSKINFTLIGTFGGLLWATAPAREEADFYKSRLREYRWTLSVSSERAEFLGYAVQMLDASRSMLNNLAEKPSLSQTQVSSAGVPEPASAPSTTQTPQDDVTMGEETPPLTRNTSVSVFSGFSTDALDQYSERSADVVMSPPSSTSG